MKNFILLNSTPTKAVHHRNVIKRYFQQGEGKSRILLFLLFHLAGALQY